MIQRTLESQAERPSGWPFRCALLAPVLLVGAIFAASGVVALVTGQPLVWPASPETLSEAIGLRDQGEAVRQMTAGADPNAPYETLDIVREGQHATLTPLEAALTTREPYMLSLVLAHGARLDAQNAPALQCAALESRAIEIYDYLVSRFGPPASCERNTQ